MKIFTDGFLKDHKLVVHIVTEDNVAAKILRDTRDLCNSEVSKIEEDSLSVLSKSCLKGMGLQ